jgi:ANTAR domain-containing protein/GAF domain-containing protein
VRHAVGSRGQRPDAGLARQLSELAREMQADTSNEALLQRIVTAAAAQVPGARYAGITLRTRRELSSPVVTDELVRRIDRLQYQTGEGPCVDSAARQETVRSDDMRTESRWPRFARAATALGVLSMLSFQLFVEDENIGAVNLYAGTAGAFTPASESTGMLPASHAALAMTAARTKAGLLAAMGTRDLIGQAKGILMERHKISEVVAFELLVGMSQALNRAARHRRAAHHYRRSPAAWPLITA